MCTDYSFPTFDDMEKDTQEQISREKMTSTFFQMGNKGSEFTEAVSKFPNCFTLI